MRWVNSAAALLAAAALAGCGNYSTEDLRFLAALPTRDDLQVRVPEQASDGVATGALSSAAAAAAVCENGTAETWGWAKPTSDGLNALVDLLVGLVDAIRAHPPSWRDEDVRGWGPFDDERHPGREIRVVLLRSWPAGEEAAPEFSYAFEARVKGTGPWRTVLGGTFAGASATLGSGTLVLDFEALWALGMADPDSPRGTLAADYDRTSVPRTISLALDRSAADLPQFGYGFAGYPGGAGRFDYAFRNARGDLLTVQAGFDAAGAGRAQVIFTASGGFTGGFRQCWDASACLTYVADPFNYSCGPTPPPGGCSLGALSACPAVPAPPF